MGSIFLRKETYYLKYKDATGVWRMVTAATSDKQQAQDKLLELEHAALVQRRGGSVAEDHIEDVANPTVGELLQWWLVQGARTESTLASVAAHIIHDPFAQLLARDVRPRDIHSWQERLHAPAADGGKDLAVSTCGWLRKLLASAYSAAMRQSWPLDRWFTENPVHRSRALVDHDELGDVEDYPCLRTEQIAPVLMAIPPEHRALFATAIYTGLRRGELCALRQTDVDFARARILVRRSYTQNRTKTRTTRAVPINSELAAWLAGAIAEARDRWAESPAATANDLVFPNRYGRMREPTSDLSGILRKALIDSETLSADPRERARQLEMTFHDLRHTTASLLIAAGATLSEVQTYLGHSNPAITAKIYVHLSKDHLAGVGALLEGKFGATAPTGDITE